MKKNMRTVLTLGMVLTVAGGTATVASANENTDKDVMTVTATPLEDAEKTEGEAEEVTAAYITNEGTIKSITKMEDGNVEVLMDNEAGGLRFILNATSTIIDRETGKAMTAAELTEGTVVSVIYGALSPMGMSMPPYLGRVSAVVANADKGNFIVSKFDKDLLDAEGKLKLNIGEDTTILTTLGTKNILTAENIQDKNALVFYDVTTRSIPAQTTPSFVLLLEEKEVAEVPETKTPETEAPEAEVPETTSFLALRDAAEELGYEVTWQGKTKPILVEKEATKIEISLNDATYVVNDVEKESDLAAKLVDGVLYVSSAVLAD